MTPRGLWGCMCICSISPFICHQCVCCTFSTASPSCLSSCWTWHFPIWALRGVTLTLHKWDAAGRFKAALALLTACLLQLSASWGSLTPVISVATVFSQFPLAGLILPNQARREKVTTDLTTELYKSGIINLIHTLKELHLLEKNTAVCQFKTTLLASY